MVFALPLIWLTVLELCCCLFVWDVLLLFLFFCVYMVSLCSPGSPGTPAVDQVGFELRHLPASASGVVELNVCTTTARAPVLGLFLVSPWVQLICSGWDFLSSAFCRAGLVDRHCFHLVLSFFSLHQLWVIVFLGIVVWAGICALSEFVEQLARPFWLSESPLKSQVSF